MKKNDINDTLRTEGVDAVRARHDKAKLYNGAAGHNGTTIEKRRRILLDVAADIPIRQVEWVWRDRVARRKITLIAGDPDLGKSQVSLDIVARISRGEVWPDGGRAPLGSSIILSAEDAADDTLVPRLHAADADVRRVRIMRAVETPEGKRSSFSLQTDLEALGEAIAELGDVVLIVIDPITSYMGANIDSHRTTDVRSVLEMVKDFAERFNVAIVAISHPPKNAQGKAINAVTGSLAFTAAPRIVFLAIADAEHEGRTLLLTVKNNLSPGDRKHTGIGYRLAGRIIDGDTFIAPHIVWDNEPVTMTANEALATAADGAKDASALVEAVEFLREELANGPVAVGEIKQRAATLGIAERTLRRAQKKLGIEPEKQKGVNSPWQWRLPERGVKTAR